MKAVIFDMDGVLINSEPLHLKVDQMMLLQLGIHEQDGYLDKFVGCTSEETWRQILDEQGLTLSMPELMTSVLRMKLQYLAEHDFAPIDGIVPLLDFLQREHIKLAIASSSSRIFIDAVLNKLALTSYFDVMTSGEDVMYSKPCPDVFLKAQQLLGVEKSDCFIVEDSASGVMAAHRAGIDCVGFHNPDSGHQDLSLATIIITRISALNSQKIHQLLHY